LDIVNLEDYKYSGANITAMRLIDPSRKEVREVIQDFINLSDNGNQPTPLERGQYLRVSSALKFFYIRGMIWSFKKGKNCV
jgi:hypothetical protein